MKSKPICIRIKNDLLAQIEAIAEKHEWSRNYVIQKFLKEKCYELTGEC